jgi:hypothetical protein
MGFSFVEMTFYFELIYFKCLSMYVVGNLYDSQRGEAHAPSWGRADVRNQDIQSTKLYNSDGKLNHAIGYQAESQRITRLARCADMNTVHPLRL